MNKLIREGRTGSPYAHPAEYALRETSSQRSPAHAEPDPTAGQVTEVEERRKIFSNEEEATVIAGFLPTKLTMPPTPPGLVPRERLFAALDVAVRGPLTLVAGSAGIGKSALVSSWINSGRAPGRVVWLSLDASDDSRPRFWRLMLAALASAGVGADENGARLAISSDQTVDTVLPALVGLLSALEEPVVVVLDDFDEITDPAIMADIELLLRTPPPALRLIATARRAPSLRVQRLRLSGAVTEIDARELIFTNDEARGLLEGAGVSLNDHDLRLLWERTEGWAAGLRLTAMALRNRGDAAAFVQQFAGDEAPVADYLFEEILSAQPAHIREFLLRTSITDTICGELADALTGQAGGGATLAELQQDGVMATALDDHREWFRYHGLFAGLLRSVLRREDPARVPELHRRAARWLADHGRGVEAASHAATAQDWDLLGDVVASQSFSLLVRGELSELAQVLQQVPSPRIQSNPVFPLAIAGAALEVGDFREAEAWLGLADASQDLVREQDREAFHIGRAIIGLYRCRLTGDVAAALDDARVLMGDGEGAFDELGFATDLRALALINLGALELWTGRLDDALRDLDFGIEAAQARSLEYLELYGRAHRAVYHLWSGDPRAAKGEADAAMELADRRGWRGTPRASVALAVQGILALIHGDVDQAETSLVTAARAIARSVERPLRAHVAANTARVMRAKGRPADGLKAMAEVRADVADSPFWEPIRTPALAIEALLLNDLGRTDEAVALIEPETAGDDPDACVALAEIRLTEGRPQDALELVARGLAGRSMVTTQVRGDVIAALAHRALGDETAAVFALERALDEAAPHDCRLPFLTSGPMGAELLEAQLRAGTAHRTLVTELVQQLAAGHGRPSALAEPRPAMASAALPEPLSDRELAVLRYLPTVMSNREIADELFVSVNTVKTHVKQIYRKLGAHDRRDAITRARRAGLLAPPSSLS